ncbi:hypothetical protein NE236_25040 [Actinoallomurus purpureus]|uniref:hypothetical protein n=1 Tax=Actinoallomurus purpureus TaxID=478114 RepID=UPI0020925FB1|nr:hypothetical protein [Actinoallomurus purpureus]MCO6008248.1 hypothetical protein [Actinoallomurus purpureus]
MTTNNEQPLDRDSGHQSLERGDGEQRVIPERTLERDDNTPTRPHQTLERG